MRNLLLICMVGLVFTASACKGKDDVLATYKGGKITRGELYDWIEANNFNKESILKSKNMQKSKLEAMVMERFAIGEAKKEGFDKTSEFKMLSDMTTESQLVNLVYKKEVDGASSFKEPAVRISQIVLRAKAAPMKPGQKPGKPQPVDPAELAKVTAQAKAIIESLGKGGDFKDIASKQSEDFTKKNGGDAGFIVAEMINPALTKAAFALKEGEYTKEPVVVDSSVYIIKVTDVKEITQDNIDKIIDNKAQAARIKARLMRKSGEEYITGLKKAPDVVVNIDKVKSANVKDVIFKVGEIVYTVGDLNKRMALFADRFRRGPQAQQKITDDQKKSIVENILKYELLNRVATQKGINKDPEFIKKIQFKRDSLLAREYMRKIGESVSKKVTEAEMRAEYDQNKDKRYYTMVKKGVKNEKVIEPYAKVRERIEKILSSKKNSDEVKTWKDKITKDNAFTINEKDLEGDK
jgi:peptidyl-prolyl cis-trans isomerase C